MLSWGDVLLARYGKLREAAWHRDITLQKLEYCTQNGAYYYYNVAHNMSAEGLLLELASDAKRTQTPYAYWLADSWWYRRAKPPRGVPRGGVIEWEPLQAVESDDDLWRNQKQVLFPRGLEVVHRVAGWLVQAHARYWSSEAIYAHQNGGAHSFHIDRRSGFALPASTAFWD